MQTNTKTMEELANLFGQASHFLKQGKYTEAENNYLAIIEVIPDHADSLNYLGAINHLKGEHNKALQYLKKAAAISSNDPEILFNLGCVYQAINDWEKAKQSFEKAISLKPDYAMAHNNLSVVMVSLGDFKSQRYHVEKAYAISPDELEIMVNYATFLTGISRFFEAIEVFKKAFAINPKLDKVNASLCHALYKVGLHEEGQKYLRRVDFTSGNLSADSSSFLFLYNYEPSATPEEIFKAHQEWGNALVKQIGEEKIRRKYPQKASSKLRIGYVSPNYGYHPVPYFLENILENHDKTQFTLIAYSRNKQEDHVTERLKQYFDVWRNIGETNSDDIYELIVKDEIDILVDLAGHSSQHILGVFARKPAPVQITYLGYPNTTGLPNMDYRITDQWCDPVGITDKWHTETLIRLKTGFLCYKPRNHCPPVASLPYQKNGYITFGCFNNPLKVNNEVISVWSDIVNQVPGSVLVLKDRIYSNKEIRDKTLDRLTEHGISMQQIKLYPPIKDDYDAMDAYNNIDIALDAFPYNGTTTTSEALWMGVPVIALVGETHVSRVSYSILNQIGLTELACFSKSEYVEKAIELASNPDKLNNLRNNLRDKCLHSTFTDGKAFTKMLESTYKEVWDKYESNS